MLDEKISIKKPSNEAVVLLQRCIKCESKDGGPIYILNIYGAPVCVKIAFLIFVYYINYDYVLYKLHKII